MNHVREVDGVYVNNKGDSLGTLIKKEATSLYDNYYNLDFADKSVVALGLNSILDVSSYESPQKRLFSNEAWQLLREKYQRCFAQGVDFSPNLDKKILKIEKLALEDVSAGRKKCLVYEATTNSKVESDIISIYSQCLELLEFHSYVFDKNIDITEGDITVKIWSPIIERLFRRVTLRTKWGESVGDSSEATNGPGFKVDLRIVKDTISRRRNEADKANDETARLNPGLLKITGDRTKLHIESRTVLDKLVQEVPEKAAGINIPGLQLLGNKATLYSLKLAANGLYVAVKEASATVPNHARNIKDFRETVKLLLKFKDAVMELDRLGLAGDDEQDDNDNNSSNRHASWVRGTWVPPNNDKKVRMQSIPENLYFYDL